MDDEVAKIHQNPACVGGSLTAEGANLPLRPRIINDAIRNCPNLAAIFACANQEIISQHGLILQIQNQNIAGLFVCHRIY